MDAQVIEQGYRFPLDPTPVQADAMACWLGASRFWFNAGLAEVKDRLDRRAAGESVDVPWTYKALCSVLDKHWRAQRAPWQAELPSGAYKSGFEALGPALRNFSARRARFPHFKRKGRCQESVLFQAPRLLDARHVELSRAHGPVRVKERMTKLLRLLADDSHARVKRATITRQGRTWWVSFTVQRSPKRRRARRPAAAGGVDVGLARLVTLSTGLFAVNSRPLQTSLRAMRRLQRQLDRQRRANNPGNYHPDGRVKKGCTTWVKSQRMLRTERRIAALHERVANLRREQAHQLTTALTREFGVIGVETLAVKNLMGNRRLARHIPDVGWGMVLSQLKYKTSWSDGSILVAADRFYPSSKTCSACGAVKAKLRLADRVFTCDGACGLMMDRDENAALNLAHMAQQHAQAEGSIKAYVARIGRFTPTARGGQVSLVRLDEHSPVKREASPDASQRREALAAP